MSNTVMVKSGLQPAADGAQKVALWEVDPAHPGGEVFVAAHVNADGEVVNEPVEVGRTAAVGRKLADGELVEVPAALKRRTAIITPPSIPPAGDTGGDLQPPVV